MCSEEAFGSTGLSQPLQESQNHASRAERVGWSRGERPVFHPTLVHRLAYNVIKAEILEALPKPMRRLLVRGHFYFLQGSRFRMRASRKKSPPQINAAKTTGMKNVNLSASTRTCVATAPPR
jgi:hypothetical protein